MVERFHAGMCAIGHFFGGRVIPLGSGDPEGTQGRMGTDRHEPAGV